MRRLLRMTLATLAIFAAAESSRADKLPAGAKPLTPGELQKIYSGMTLSWRDGPGGWYFSPDGKLSALAKGSVYAYGKWWLTKSGQVCVKATWRWKKASSARSVKNSCWAHAKVGRTIWKESDGKWYKWTGNESQLFSKGYKYQKQVNALYKKYGG